MKKTVCKKNSLKNISVFIIVYMLVSLGIFSTKQVGAKVIANDKTGIPDKNLYQAILVELDKKSDEMITDDEVRELRVLEKYFSGDNENIKISSLKGIEKLENLIILDISVKGLSSLKGIEKLTKLELLDASNNKLTKLPSLKRIKKLNLEHSTFVGNRITEKEFRKKLKIEISRVFYDKINDEGGHIVLKTVKFKIKK